MRFQNYTPFPAMGWKSIDKHSHTYISVVVRVKYLFDTADANGQWRLKLDPDQGELFGKDIFYDEEDVEHSSVRFESDYVPYKPHADLVVNAYGHATVPLKEWRCGVKVSRSVEEREDDEVLLEKWIRVRGERYMQDNVIGVGFTPSKEATKVPIRYEYANGGAVENPNYDPENPKKHKKYLLYSTYNPVGVGVFHKIMFEKNVPLRAPQIEAMDERIDKPNLQNPPQGFGFLGRSWQPRIKKAGTFDKKWIEEKHPVLPDDYQEAYNNAAHPDLQLTHGYFEPFDKIILYNVVKDRHEQSFEIPNFYFKAQIEDGFTSAPHFLNIDTVVVDLLEDDMSKNAVYISYRNRIPSGEHVEQAKVNMFVPKDFIGASHG